MVAATCLSISAASLPLQNAVANAGPPARDKEQSSGMKGKVLLGPTCPVETEPPDPNCAEKPYARGLLAVSRAGKMVAKAKTDRKGEFSIALPPGTYIITQLAQNFYPRIHSEPIVIVKNKFTSVIIHGDTGIR